MVDRERRDNGERKPEDKRKTRWVKEREKGRNF